MDDHTQSFSGIYMIQGTEPVTQLTSQFQQVMDIEGSPAYFVDQSLYNPGATGYGYISAGFVPVSDWEGNQGSFGMESDDSPFYSQDGIHENLPYLYYAPSYGYTESPYNPYNPYIPGALVEGDGLIASSHQYYVLPSYGDSVLPAHMPLVIQSSAEATTNETPSSFKNDTRSALKANKIVDEHKLSSDNSSTKETAILGNNFLDISQGGKQANNRSGKHLPLHSKHLESSKVSLAQKPQGKDTGIHDKGASDSCQLQSYVTSPCFDCNTHDCTSMDGINSMPPCGKFHKDAGECYYAWNDLNWTSESMKFENQLVLKAYTMRAGNPNAEGNIIIFKDQYNCNDFPVYHVNAKFFVIKSYSEDDVHKSVKYNVWSSTPGGNKKLNAAYEDAQRDDKGCPIFLFFSVNASGQFCGVAEMIGSVDFQTDMDFWQQDKWSGSFRVKWHMIKDVPNPIFRHITLDNNEHKPVTNSRDTQEIPHKKGLEMLRIFKNYTSKTSLLDDFMYYENRQRVLLQERARLKHITKLHESISSSGELNSLGDEYSVPEKHLCAGDDAKGSSQISVDKKGTSQVDGPLTLNQKRLVAPASRECNIITIGSMPVSFTGRIPLDSGSRDK